jgi:starvation-inducible outer membrane lipoprotein
MQPRVFLNVAVFQAASVSDVRQGGKLEKIPSIEHKHAVEWFQPDVETAGRPSITPTQKRLILY